MVNIKKERLYKLHCPTCDSREKVLAIVRSHGSDVGFFTICCNCGHIAKYVLRDYENIMSVLDEHNMTAMLTGEFEIDEYRCGTNQPYCPRKDCPYYDGHSHHAHYPEGVKKCHNNHPDHKDPDDYKEIKEKHDTIKRYL